MSWQATDYITNLTVCPNGELITASEKCVAFVLANFHQAKPGAQTYPSVETISYCGMKDTRSVFRHLSSLERKGVIERNRMNSGRGAITYYRFPALDDQNSSGGIPNPKGCQNVTLFPGKRVAEGWQKDDKTGSALYEPGTASGTAQPAPVCPIPNNGSSRELFPDDSPEIDAACKAVLSACSWTKPRLYRSLRRTITMQVSKGQPAATVGLEIIHAWKYQVDNASMLWNLIDPLDFLELGIWRDANLLHWDREKVERLRQASTGSAR